jgi:hypothetical protein
VRPFPLLGVVAAAVAVVLSACGGNEGLAESARKALAPQVAEVRRAAESFQPDVARQGLAAVRHEVSVLRRRGTIDGAQAAELIAAVAGVESHLGLAPTTTTTTSPRLPAGQDNGKDKGKGKDQKD